MNLSTRLILIVSLAILRGISIGTAAPFSTRIEQITVGPQHHFFGYIGHVRTIPWNQSGRYIIGLRTDFQERMPTPGEAADIILVDTKNKNAVKVIEKSRAWNFQQGTMLYWNPQAPETQFFFNDRDPKTHEIFCVLFDISKGPNGQRVAEYRFGDTPFGNSGVAQNGGWFCGINYARLARLRPVTGYPGARDWTVGVKHPENDGVFKVNTVTQEKRLLISFRQLADALRAKHPELDEKELFINHTLWNREDDLIYFFVRGDFEVRGKRLDVPCVMKSDGSDFRELAMHIGGHPDWDTGRKLVGLADTRQILFDPIEQKISGTLGTPEIFPKPGGDVAVSPDGKWFVNGHGDRGKNYYNILRRSDGAWVRTEGMNQGGYVSGELRIDPSPCWNRDNTQILIPGIGVDGKTRQMWLIHVGK